MKILKVIKKPTMNKDRWMVSVYLDNNIAWGPLVSRNIDVEFNPDIDNYPLIKTNAGTIFFLRTGIRLMNPYTVDVEPLIDFAMSKLDGRMKSKTWFEFVAFWRKEARELDDVEKKIIRRMK